MEKATLIKSLYCWAYHAHEGVQDNEEFLAEARRVSLCDSCFVLRLKEYLQQLIWLYRTTGSLSIGVALAFSAFC